MALSVSERNWWIDWAKSKINALRIQLFSSIGISDPVSDLHKREAEARIDEIGARDLVDEYAAYETEIERLTKEIDRIKINQREIDSQIITLASKHGYYSRYYSSGYMHALDTSSIPLKELVHKYAPEIADKIESLDSELAHVDEDIMIRNSPAAMQEWSAAFLKRIEDLGK